MLGPMAKKREVPERSPLGEYLAMHRGRMPVRKAAERVAEVTNGLGKLSEGRWRQIEAGYESKGDLRLPVNPRPETVAWMCLAVGADVAQGLQLAGFDPADYPELLENVQHITTDFRDWVKMTDVLTDHQRALVLEAMDRARSEIVGAPQPEAPDRSA
jgi:hypothetical protein